VTSAISVRNVTKRFRIPVDKSSTLKYRMVHPVSTARYRELLAVDDVSFDVPEGQFLGIIGSNGSGKSTLLKVLAGIYRPTRGSVVINGVVSPFLELGVGFNPELTARENVALNGVMMGLGRREAARRLDSVLEFAELAEFIDLKLKNYSSGMMVRLAFAVMVEADADVMLVDEVLAVGDAEFQQRCLEKFAELRQSGRTVVIVSHQMAALRNVCAHAALLEHGQLRAVGPATEVIDLYRDEAHSDRVADGEHGVRWGSGEVRVEAVEIIGADGEPTRTVRTGDPITLRFRYRSQEPVERPVFGFWIQRFDGAYVTAPNLRDADLVPEKVDGEGWVDYRVDRLLLLPGAYDLSAAVYDYTLNHPYDHRERTLRFDVEFGEPHEERGLVSFGGEWSMGEGTP
jgi:ABC-type polysaccharide/polyol phosphate transport system ATPase subunit